MRTRKAPNPTIPVSTRRLRYMLSAITVVPMKSEYGRVLYPMPKMACHGCSTRKSINVRQLATRPDRIPSGEDQKYWTDPLNRSQ